MFYYEGHKRLQTNHKPFLLGMTCSEVTLYSNRHQHGLSHALDIKSTRTVYLPKPAAGPQDLYWSDVIHLVGEMLAPLPVRPCVHVCLCAFADTA